MESLDGRNYELAYQINANLDEVGIQKTRQDLEALVSEKGGKILYSKDPEKIRFSYPIKKQKYAYFGYIQFGGFDPENLAYLNDNLKLKTDILRYLLTKFEQETRDNSDVIRRIAMSEKRKLARVESREKVPREEVKSEVIEKQLEELIEKIN